jgi:S-adenosylmethionine-diacylglycerol 3-amino-3-carboxypropyl transferase
MNPLIMEDKSTMDFYKHLNYSLGNEDWHVEEKALCIKSDDKVVCVTASGDRPLHILMTDCTSILSIDMNPAQNHLLNLKLAAISQLDYDKYIAFLGCLPTTHRNAIFNEIKSHLSSDAYHFWENNKKMIQHGIIYQGRMERLTYLSAIFFNLLRPNKIKTLLSFTDINEQRKYIQKHWDTFFFRKIFEIGIHPSFTKYLINDPGLNSFTDFSTTPGKYIYERMIAYLHLNLARNSPLLQLVFTGKIMPDAYFPYLTYEGYKRIRMNISRLHYATGNIIDILNEHDAGTINCFSLSDIASYMPQEVFERLLLAVLKSAKPEARFCMREFISNRTIPGHLISHFKRHNELEQKLEKEEANFVYRFIVGEVHK